MAFIQKIYDNTLAQYVYYTKATITATPVPSDTTPNHSGNLDTGTHVVIGETGANFTVKDEGSEILINTRSLNFIGADVVATAVNDDVTVTVGNGSSGSHQATHLSGGSDAIDGDKLDIDFIPVNYTRTISSGLSTILDNLTSHLNGIDIRFSSVLTGAGVNNTVPVWSTTGNIISCNNSTADITLSGGTNSSGTGKLLTLSGGPTLSGAGGSVTVTGADAVGGNNDGGSVNLKGGAKTGTGSDGTIIVTNISGRATRLALVAGTAPAGSLLPNAISIYAPTSVTAYNLVLPSTQGGSGNVLSNDGSGNLGWSSVGSGGAGNIAARRTVVGPTTVSILATDHIIYVNTTAGAVTLTLPAHGTTDRIYEIKDTKGTFGTNACTLARNGNTGTIGGLAFDYLLEAPYQIIRIASDSISDWIIH
jgi:hypothetical protein